MQRGASENNPPHAASLATPPGQNPPTPCTLDPIAAKGAEALAPDPTHGILAVAVSQLEIHRPALLHITDTIHGDDLLAPDSPIPLIPAGATLAAATLDFQVAGIRLPVIAQVRPPSTIIIGAAGTIAARIWDWLVDAHYILTKGTAMLALALAVLSAATPDTDDDDDDDGDDPHPHIHATRTT